MCLYLDMPIFACVYIWAYLYSYFSIHGNAYIHMCLYVGMPICACVYIWVCLYIYIYIYIYIVSIQSYNTITYYPGTTVYSHTEC